MADQRRDQKKESHEWWLKREKSISKLQKNKNKQTAKIIKPKEMFK